MIDFLQTLCARVLVARHSCPPKASMYTTGADAVVEGARWTCAACTYENVYPSLQCTVCSHQDGASFSPPPPVEKTEPSKSKDESLGPNAKGKWGASIKVNKEYFRANKPCAASFREVVPGDGGTVDQETSARAFYLDIDSVATVAWASPPNPSDVYGARLCVYNRATNERRQATIAFGDSSATFWKKSADPGEEAASGCTWRLYLGAVPLPDFVPGPPLKAKGGAGSGGGGGGRVESVGLGQRPPLLYNLEVFKHGYVEGKSLALSRAETVARSEPFSVMSYSTGRKRRRQSVVEGRAAFSFPAPAPSSSSSSSSSSLLLPLPPPLVGLSLPPPPPAKPTKTAKRPKVAEASTVPDDKSTCMIDSTCVVCQERPRDHLIAPCHHFCVCKPCADKLRSTHPSCPMCRGPVASVTRIYV